MVIDNIAFAPKSVDKHNVFLYHKTTNRQHFPQLTVGQEYINYNQNDEITEFAMTFRHYIGGMLNNN